MTMCWTASCRTIAPGIVVAAAIAWHAIPTPAPASAQGTATVTPASGSLSEFSRIEPATGPGLKKNNARSRALRTRLGPASGTLGTAETVWVGYSAGYSGSNYWSVGRGQALPSDGLWNWDSPVHADSLQGWWPIRRPYSITGGMSLADQDRPWWALDYGNQANYVINQGPGKRRTFGVVGVWHRDNGSAGGGGVTWAPLGGSASAWCGLRRHGDNTFVDPVTGNPFNQTVLDYNGENSPLPGATSKRFPGYGAQWDQMLYRDIDISSRTGPNLTISFKLRTRMSTGKDTAPATRTGWFDKDPLTLAGGNFISSSAAGASSPVDSFMVYIGRPVVPGFPGGEWPGSDGFTHPVFDPQRRWFAELIRANEPGSYYELYSVSGNNDATITRSIPYSAMTAWGNRIRLVFRVKTNRGFDDQDSGESGYSSGGAGAAQVDDVTVNLGSGAFTIGDFEAPDAVDNSDNVSALGSWKSTGKPPGVGGERPVQQHACSISPPMGTHGRSACRAIPRPSRDPEPPAGAI